jgi:CRP-like cAMP-binding protein
MILDLGIMRQYRPGTTLMTEGGEPRDIFLILGGLVKVTAVREDGAEALLGVRQAGDLLGEEAALDGEPQIATANAANTVSAKVIPRDQFFRTLTSSPGIGLAVNRYIIGKLRTVTRQKVDFSMGSVTARVSRAILELALTHGIPVPDGNVVDMALTQAELASLVGAGEASVQRVLAELRGRRVLATGYRKLIICDMRALRELATRVESDLEPAGL